MKKDKLLLYGAYGYTGKLIIEECLKKGIHPVLSGRNENKLLELAGNYNLEHRTLSLENSTELEHNLHDICVVLHAAGPFIHTARPMLESCLHTKTHYLDITGEYQVFEMCAARTDEAKTAGIMVMPGVGFDVVPSDCLAVHLKKRLPSAIELKLAFAGLKSGFSRGTAKTMIENLGDGGLVRIDHKLTNVPNAYNVMTVNFGDFQMLASTISWGDLSTAYISTGIPNIETYMGVTPSMVKQMQRANYLGWLFRMRWVKDFLQKQIDKRKEGPDEQQRTEGRSYFWGRVCDNAGNVRVSVLQTPEGYSLTAKTATLIASKVLAGNFKAGYHTPATAYGEGLILEVQGCKMKAID
jgi:short subunit dehydrogenase-like uncharacterized protein